MASRTNTNTHAPRFRATMRNLSRTSTRSTGVPFSLEPLKEGHRMDPKERMFLEAAERGDKHTLQRCLQAKDSVNVNCTNIIGRSAIQIAVDNENVEIVELLLKQDGVKIGDALLYAIREGVYRIVEMLINHPSVTQDMLGADWSKHRTESEDSSDYSPDISPIILAAHCNQFEILQLLLSRGARIDQPHRLTCSCQPCQNRMQEDSLRHSLLRIHTYRALSSPAWISLTSPDPVLTAFKLSWELEHLARCENEFADIYGELSEQCRKYSCDLLDQCRSSEEVMAVLNKDTGDESDDEGDDKVTLSRLKMALKYEQKQFVAHPHCQQLLASIWYSGLPGWRKRSFPAKVCIIVGLILVLPVTAAFYLFFPRTRLGQLLRTPFMKFMYHSASFGMFLCLLILASTNMAGGDQKLRQQQRGPPPNVLEWLIVFYVMGFIWAECKQLWEDGLKAYVLQWWNYLDFIMLSLYLCTFSLRIVGLWQSQHEEKYGPSNMPRIYWPENDPTLISEGVFAIANVFSFARIIYLFQASPQLGPLQISLGCMLIDIAKFFFIFLLVITSFACGLNQLYYYYSSTDETVAVTVGNCTISKAEEPFDNAFDPILKSYQTLFWSLFGLTQLTTVREGHMQDFTKRVGEYLLLTYHAMAVIVLINMLIAMMSNSFQEIEDHADREWKFARSKLWMGYFDEGSTLPSPFNLIVSPKSIYGIMVKIKNILTSCCCRSKTKRTKAARRRKDSGDGSVKSGTVSVVHANPDQDRPQPEGLDHDLVIRNVRATNNTENNLQNDAKGLPATSGDKRTPYEEVLRGLVTRYIHQWKIQMRQDGVNEDDLLEIKQDISSLRYELREDRKRGAHRTSTQIENLKREILQSIRHYSGGGPMPAVPPSMAPTDERLEQRSGSPPAAFHRSTSGAFLDRDDMDSLRRDIVCSLRSEIRDLAREMATQYVQNVRGSPVDLPAVVPALNSDLYQTHLYTEL